MLTFSWPWVALILPLPWLLRKLLPPARNERLRALHIPFAGAMINQQASATTGSAKSGLIWIAALGWLFLVAASCRPQWLGEPVKFNSVIILSDYSTGINT